ncbi:hypothetical protein ABZY14_14815 [Streptomyces sp. NPDC006617]|uniref:hypothetical protein n=1 Tax=Streptomyces sp. NPDC006617 TaxID=3155354 RepID=UPI0033AAA4E9
MTTTGTPTEPRYAWGRRGRHRRPRPRKVLLAAGGLALAAGTLSVVRLLPEPGADVGGFRAGADPRVEGGGRATTPDRATTPAGTVGEPSGAGPSATSAMGGLSGSPGPGLIPGLVPGPSASGPAVPLPTATTVRTPGAPDTRRPGEGDREREEGREPGEDTGDRAPAPGTPAPQPSRSDRPAPPPPPDRGTPPTSDPEPEPDDPGLCVPVIGLCVHLLGG